MVHARPERLQEAFRESYEIAANWKIIVENYLECYHCRSNHPELCSSMALDAMYTATTGWSGEYLGGATPLRPGRLSMSIGGGLVAPPLGDRQLRRARCAHDSGFAIVPMLTRLICHVDHLVVHLLRPLDVGRTRWETRWFVSDTAVKGIDFDVDALTAVWRRAPTVRTSRCARAPARGVRSPRFVPGPLHPELEAAVAAALDVYRQLMARP